MELVQVFFFFFEINGTGTSAIERAMFWAMIWAGPADFTHDMYTRTHTARY